MVAAFIRDRGVTMCPAHRVQHGGPSASGREKPGAFLHRGESVSRTPEGRLASAKILVMLQDLCGTSRCTLGERFKTQNDASRWFFSPPGTTDFELWCEMAGFDPDVVRSKARAAMETGMKWRAEPRKGKYYEKRRAYRERRKQRGLQ